MALGSTLDGRPRIDESFWRAISIFELPSKIKTTRAFGAAKGGNYSPAESAVDSLHGSQGDFKEPCTSETFTTHENTRSLSVILLEF